MKSEPDEVANDVKFLCWCRLSFIAAFFGNICSASSRDDKRMLWRLNVCTAIFNFSATCSLKFDRRFLPFFGVNRCLRAMAVKKFSSNMFLDLSPHLSPSTCLVVNEFWPSDQIDCPGVRDGADGDRSGCAHALILISSLELPLARARASLCLCVCVCCYARALWRLDIGAATLLAWIFMSAGVSSATGVSMKPVGCWELGLCVCHYPSWGFHERNLSMS